VQNTLVAAVSQLEKPCEISLLFWRSAADLLAAAIFQRPLGNDMNANFAFHQAQEILYHKIIASSFIDQVCVAFLLDDDVR